MSLIATDEAFMARDMNFDLFDSGSTFLNLSSHLHTTLQFSRLQFSSN